MSDMLTPEEAISKAHAAITHDYPGVRNWSGLTEVLQKLWDHATERAAFDHQMAVLAHHYAQAITKLGPSLVAARLNITVTELQRRITPEVFSELTMSELRLLSLCAEVEVSYHVIPRQVPESL
jgi:hypothetical protein